MDQLAHWKEECRRLEAENAQLRQECLRRRRQELLEHLLRGEFKEPLIKSALSYRLEIW